MTTQQSQSSSLAESQLNSRSETSSMDPTTRNATQSSVPSTSGPTNPGTSIQVTPDSSASASSPKQCSHCKFTKEDLKPCKKCHTMLYCSRDCQKAAWKTHKKRCAEDAQAYALANPARLASAPRVPKKDGHRGGLQKWQFDT